MPHVRHALAALLMTAGALGAQAANDPDRPAAQGNDPMPAGWSFRLDNPAANRATLRFVADGGALHVTAGPAATYWNPANRTTGAYTLQATFTQMKAPAHAEAYGLIWGGGDIDGANQNYLYFVIRKDGKYLVRHRAGAATHNIQEWTEHPAIVKEGADGRAANTLRVEVTTAGSRLYANDQLVLDVPRQGMAQVTDGEVGMRINHNLDVRVTDFAVRK